MSVETDRALDAGAAACPCRRGGDAAAEVARQRPLLERAARGDREAFARLYLTQVDGVYRYLLAWTGGQAAAKELTEQAFRAAAAWLPVTAGGEAGGPRAYGGDVGAWLVAMARDAVAQWREGGWLDRGDRQAPPTDALEAVTMLGDPEREVVVLRLLLGHSLVHTAQLSGYSQRAVTELQLAACLAIRELTGAPDGDRPPEPAPPVDPATPASSTAPGQRAAEFERRLERWDVDLVGDDSELADALAVASSLRLAAGSLVVAPDRSFVLRLRAALASERPEAAGGGPLRSARRALASLRAEVVSRPRPWAATAVAATAILVILTLQAFGSPRPPACRGRPCPATTTPAAAPAPASATAAPLTSIRQETTTTSLPPTTALAAPLSTAPPSTSPASTAPRTTRPPRTTTTRQPTTTTATTTSTTTATTGPTTST